MLTSIYYWIPTIFPMMTQTPEQFTMPPLPQMEDSHRKEALWTAYWSPRVEQLMKQWQHTVWQLQKQGMRIDVARAMENRGQRPSTDSATLILDLPGFKDEVFQADKLVREQVRLELLGKHDGHAEEPAADSSPPS
jgi:N-dimethylarginine dimethylaminohydrolase